MFCACIDARVLEGNASRWTSTLIESKRCLQFVFSMTAQLCSMRKIQRIDTSGAVQFVGLQCA